MNKVKEKFKLVKIKNFLFNKKKKLNDLIKKKLKN